MQRPLESTRRCTFNLPPFTIRLIHIFSFGSSCGPGFQAATSPLFHYKESECFYEHMEPLNVENARAGLKARKYLRACARGFGKAE